MNRKGTREVYRRDLAQRLAHLRLLVSEQRVQREMSIRRHGIAHPRSIAVSQRLNRTLGAWRQLHRLHRAAASQDGRGIVRRH